MRHFDSLMRLTGPECHEILRLSADVKARFQQGNRPRLLDGHMLTLVFEKPSLRTRVSFEAAITHLGGSSLFLTCAEAGLNGREAIPDVARVLGTYSDWIVTRSFSHRLVDLGMTKVQAVLTIYLTTATCGLGALLLRRVDTVGAVMIVVMILCILSLIAILEASARRRAKP